MLKKDVKVTPYLHRAENEKKIGTLWLLRRIKEGNGKFHSISKTILLIINDIWLKKFRGTGYKPLSVPS